MRLSERVAAGQVLAGAIVVSVAFNLWIGRGLTFTSDELAWFMLSPDLDLEQALHPYVGHLVVTSKLLYKGIFETIGTDYLTFRLIAALVLVAVVWILFRLLRRFCGEWPALAVCLPVLFFGGDASHVFHGNGITVLGSVGCGLLALLLLCERTSARSAFACLALCVGVATYSQALPFLVGATVFLLLLKRARDLWVVAIPFLVYLGWWIWARNLPTSSQNDLDPLRIIELPVWGFRAIGAVSEHLLPVPDAFGQTLRVAVGLIAAAALVALLIWLYRRNRGNPLFFAGAAVLVTMWSMVIVVPVESRDFDSPRYMFPFLIAMAITWGSLLGGLKPGRVLNRIIWAAVGLVCLAGIYQQVHHIDRERETVTLQLRAGLAGIEAVRPTYERLSADDVATSKEDSELNLALRALEDLKQPSVASYSEAVNRYGIIGYTAEELREEGRKARFLADRAAARSAGLTSAGLIPGGPGDRRCVGPVFLFPGQQGVAVPPGAFEVRNPTSQPAPLFIRKFSHRGIPVAIVPARSAVLFGPNDNDGEAGFRLSSRGPTLTVCRFPLP